jgi:predicted kinase
MPLITLTTGLPASGKSTFARQLVSDTNNHTTRVNMDDLRKMMGLPPTTDAAEQKVVLDIQDRAILAAVKHGKDVVVDNTHLVPTIPKRIRNLFHGNVEFAVADFTHVPVEACLTRDVLRAESVGASTIKKFAKLLDKDWRLTAEFMNEREYPIEMIRDNQNDLCVVFDIDGTLARHHRSPYDYTKVSTDSVFEHIRNLPRLYYDAGYTVIICSGRPGSDQIRKDTTDWLIANDIPFDHLYMREEFDKRNDADVKQQIVLEKIAPSHHIEHWFDDRNRVVDRLRAMGINVSQVAPGDF